MKTATHTPEIALSDRTMLVAGLSVLIGAVAVLFRTGILGADAEFDELYHLLAARSWNADGSFAILDGEYTRGAFYTRAVGATMALLGSEDLFTARLLSLVIGALTPVLAFLAINRLVSLPVALIVAVYMILWPQGILESQSVRFYGAQVLAFLTGAYAFYRGSLPDTNRSWLWGLIAFAAWAAAFHFQITSIVGVAGAFAGMFCIVVYERTETWRGRIMIFGGVLILAAIVFAVATQTGILAKAWSFYRWTPGHAEALRDYVGFYHKQFENRYGLMWWTAPVWIGIAFYARPRLTFYAMAIFFTCFVVHSFSGMKSLRYLSYASPMMFMVWAISFVWIWEQIRDRAGAKIASGVAAVAAVAMLALSDFPTRSYNFAMGEGFSAREDWSGVDATLDVWTQAPFIATTRELHMAAYVSDFDMIVSRSRVSELKPPVDFTTDFRTGRVTIGDAESVAAVLACERDGLMVTPVEWWADTAEGQTFQELIAAAGLQAESRTSADIIAIRWTDPANTAPDCSGVPGS